MECCAQRWSWPVLRSQCEGAQRHWPLLAATPSAGNNLFKGHSLASAPWVVKNCSQTALSTRRMASSSPYRLMERLLYPQGGNLVFQVPCDRARTA